MVPRMTLSKSKGEEVLCLVFGIITLSRNVEILFRHTSFTLPTPINSMTLTLQP